MNFCRLNFPHDTGVIATTNEKVNEEVGLCH